MAYKASCICTSGNPYIVFISACKVTFCFRQIYLTSFDFYIPCNFPCKRSCIVVSCYVCYVCSGQGYIFKFSKLTIPCFFNACELIEHTFPGIKPVDYGFYQLITIIIAAAVAVKPAVNNRLICACAIY